MKWLLAGYFFIFIHRPFEVWPVLGDHHFERVYVVVAALCWCLTADKRWLSDTIHLALFGFAAAVLACWLVSPWAEYAQPAVENYFKLLVCYGLVVTTIHDEADLRQLVLYGFLGGMFIYMSHSLWEYHCGRHTYRMGVARMIGVDTTLGDPNSFGASLVYALPLVVPFWRDRPSPRMKSFLLGFVGLAVVCIGLTGSRSSLLGLGAWAALLGWKSQRRWTMLVLIAVAAPLLFLLLPSSLQDRFETIVNPESGPASAIESGNSRWEALPLAMKLLDESPLTGCGPAAWRPATGRKLESHNLYGQLLGEMGMLGVLSFTSFVGVLWSTLRWVQRQYREQPDWQPDFLLHLSRAIGMSVFLLLFEGNFGHNLFRYNWVWYAAFLVIIRYCLEARLHADRRYEVAAGTYVHPRAYQWTGTPV